jgi:hypothetical protein
MSYQRTHLPGFQSEVQALKQGAVAALLSPQHDRTAIREFARAEPLTHVYLGRRRAARNTSNVYPYIHLHTAYIHAYLHTYVHVDTYVYLHIRIHDIHYGHRPRTQQ